MTINKNIKKETNYTNHITQYNTVPSIDPIKKVVYKNGFEHIY